MDPDLLQEQPSRIVEQARKDELLSSEHFSVAGMLIRAWAWHKRFVPQNGAPPPAYNRPPWGYE